MLVLDRREGQRIIIGEGANQVVVTLIEGRRDFAKLGFEGPREVKIVREKVEQRNQQE